MTILLDITFVQEVTFLLIPGEGIVLTKQSAHQCDIIFLQQRHVSRETSWRYYTLL